MNTTETLDFLREIVETIPDPSNGGTIDPAGDDRKGRKKGAAGGRRKAAAQADVTENEAGTEGETAGEEDDE